MSRTDTGFDERLAYVLWLRARGRVRIESDREIAEAAGVGYAWLQKWKKRREAPDDRKRSAALVEALGLETGSWLLDGDGAAPEGDLFKQWLAMRAHERPQPSVAAKKRKRGT